MSDKVHPIDPSQRLASYYQGKMAGVLHPIEYIQGVLFAAATAPEIPMPQQWMPWVFKQHGQLPSNQEADALADTLMAVFRQILDDMRKDQVHLPLNIRYQEAEHSPLTRWCTGVTFAHAQLEAVWQSAWQKMLDKHPDDVEQKQKDLRHCLRMFSTFANPVLAIEQAMERGNDALETQLPLIFQGLPKALSIYVELSGALVDYLPNQFETFEQFPSAE